MKLLFDPVYTQRPSVCSTSYLCWEIIQHLIAQREDVFFYVAYPEQFEHDEIEQAFLRRHSDRVTLLPIKQSHTDRTTEQFSASPSLKTLYGPGRSPAWDADILFTSRLPQVVNLRASFGREQSQGKGSVQKIVALEEMPIFSFRNTVPWGAKGRFDLHMLAAYLQADAVIISNLWTKNRVVQLARQYLAPSIVRTIGDHLHETVPVRLQRLTLKAPKPKDQEINVVFTGRMTTTRNFAAVAELFRRHFAYAVNGKKAKFLISTNSTSSGGADNGEIDFIDLQHNGREEFHAFLGDADVAVNLSTVEDFSLSTYETMLHGVPLIVSDEPWAEFLGPDYPFRAKNQIQAYAFLKAFLEDYPAAHARFVAWEESYWKAFVENQPPTTSEIAANLVTVHEADAQALIAKGDLGKVFGKLTQAVSKTDLTTVAPLEWGLGEGFIKSDAISSISRTPIFYVLKHYMLAAGWRDTNKVGVYAR